MAAALVKFVTLDAENASPSEIVSTFSDHDFLSASQETSNTYNGLVLAHALMITQARTRSWSILALSEDLGISKNALYRWAKGKPISRWGYERAMRLLGLELLHRGIH